MGSSCAISGNATNRRLKDPQMKLFMLVKNMYKDSNRYCSDCQEKIQNAFDVHIEILYNEVDKCERLKKYFELAKDGEALAEGAQILSRQNDIYLFSRGYHFLLGLRFTQDALENVFSYVRRLHKVPNAAQVTPSFRKYSVAQVSVTSRGSYPNDEQGVCLDPLGKSLTAEVSSEEENDPDEEISDLRLAQVVSKGTQYGESSMDEQLPLVYILCFMFHRIHRKLSCDTCKADLEATDDFAKNKVFKLIEAKEYGSFFHCSEKILLARPRRHFLEGNFLKLSTHSTANDHRTS